MNATRYRQVLDHLLQSIDIHNSQIFMQDGSIIYFAKTVIALLWGNNSKPAGYIETQKKYNHVLDLPYEKQLF